MRYASTMSQQLKLALACVALLGAAIIMYMNLGSGSPSTDVAPPNQFVEFSRKLNMHDSVRYYYCDERVDSEKNTVTLTGVVETQADLDGLKQRVNAISPKPTIVWEVKVGKLPIPLPGNASQPARK